MEVAIRPSPSCGRGNAPHFLATDGIQPYTCRVRESSSTWGVGANRRIDPELGHMRHDDVPCSLGDVDPDSRTDGSSFASKEKRSWSEGILGMWLWIASSRAWMVVSQGFATGGMERTFFEVGRGTTVMRPLYSRRKSVSCRGCAPAGAVSIRFMLVGALTE